MSHQLQTQAPLSATPAPVAEPQSALQDRPFGEDSPETATGTTLHQNLGSATPSNPPPGPNTPLEPPFSSHDFGHIALSCGPIQAQLTVGAPGDPYEQEADRIADQVMAMADSPPQAAPGNEPPGNAAGLSPQTEASLANAPEQTLWRSPEISPSPLTPVLSRQENASGRAAGPAAVSTDLEAKLSRNQGSGNPLPNDFRQFIEPRMGFDFSQVRVHTDSEAVQMNQQLSARAFAHGSDIYFGSSQLDTKSDEGKRLLAHELTHVVQQQQGAHRSIQKWDSPEHVALGDVTGLTIDLGGGVELTFGQVVALAGDEFGSLDQLMDATKTTDGRSMIRAHLERAGIPGETARLLPAPTDEQRKQANTEYITLASDNSAHFAGGGTAINNWFSHHSQAVDLALQSGLFGNPSLMNQAYMTEAFGAHFLTDAFSSGHIRVPRQEITDYYTNEFAPRVFDHLLNHLRNRLIDEIYNQIDEQTILDEAAFIVGGIGGGLGARGLIRREIRSRIDEKLDAGFREAGGRDAVVRYLGLGLAGIIAGAMHDMENRDGLMVISNIDSEPWKAYGDNRLNDNPVHRAHVEEAVRTSVADLERAHIIGLEEGQNLFNVIDVTALPEAVYFGFDADVLTAEAAAQVDILAHYLNYNPATVLSIVGHTDPVGRDPYNQDLSSRRAERVANRLLTAGVDAARISVDAKGEQQLVTTNRAEYFRNRRVEFTYATSGTADTTQESSDLAYQNAFSQVLTRVGPPYAVEDHFPRAADGLNQDLPEWRWGSLSPSFQAEMNAWISHYINEYSEAALSGDALEEEHISKFGLEFTVSPRPIARKIVGEILANPTRFLSQAMGQAAGS